MTLKSFLTTFLTIATTVTYAQTKRLIVPGNIAVPRDTSVSKPLIAALDNFLIAAQKPNEENTFIFPDEKIETFIQLDEVFDIEKSKRFNNEHFYKPYLTNIVAIENNQYLIKVSYIGVNDSIPILCGSFEFIAHKSANSYLFSSPLIRNTKNWKTTTAGNNTFHYQTSINQTKLKEFEKLASAFDKKLKATNKKCVFYLCRDFVELQKLVGVDYKIQYNSYAQNNLTSSIGDNKLIILGSDNATFDNFDPHDLWHDRLSLVISRSKVNKPLDEAYAYLYGGSWGVSWAEIFKLFKEKVASNKNTNWMEVKEQPLNFSTDPTRPMMADYVVDALLLKKIEKEKGFDGVWEFLNCGPYEKGNENFYKALEKLTGITKANYNEKVWELVEKEK